MKTARGMQFGFSLTKRLLVIAAVLVVSGTGWYVYRDHQHPPRTTANTVASTSQTTIKLASAPTIKPAQPAQAATTYLTISQWNVKLPLPSAINTAYYVVPNGMSPDPDGEPSAVIVGVHSLDRSCGTVSADPRGFSKNFGEIVRVPSNATHPVTRQTYKQEYPNGTTIGNYYYGFLGPTSKTCAGASTLKSMNSAFATATKSTVTAATAAN